ncbi:hypothetical protein AMJ57_02035 [Parcubacteria bacterium SG8_24]|nr:MAG: hypothetical protein AMJ57_02035 [Parcubacteria bacterium SG8_24]
MIYLKTKEEIDIIREGGIILSETLGKLVRQVRPGVGTGELDELAERLIYEAGGRPSFKGYMTEDDIRPFPSSVCLSINQEVVHAPAKPSRDLKEGDILKLDIGLQYRGLYTDMAMTVPVGQISEKAERLIKVTRESLERAVGQTIAGNYISDIGRAVDNRVTADGFTTVKALVGHGVGKHVHEDPRIPNFVDPTLEPTLIRPGMVLALEPMVNAGTDEVALLPDGWTVVTADSSLSAHFEVTVAVTEEGNEVMTPLPKTF